MINIVEVFSSIQGEGALVGYRQIFVRLSGCNLKCSYCDTAHSQTNKAEFASLECTPGRQDFIKKPNALSIDYLADHINKLSVWPHHSVSLTGGEPLCQAEAVEKLASRINAPVYLETNGTLPDMLDIILRHVEYISMDIKLPSANTNTNKTTKGVPQEYWREHAAFLKKAFLGGKNIFVKIIITEETMFEEIKTAVDLMVGISNKIPLIIQPVTPLGNSGPISFETIMPFFEFALKKIDHVRVIPQTHKILGII